MNMGGYLFFLYLHILFATFWVGGMLFLPLVMLPSIKDNVTKNEIIIKTGLKFRYYGWWSLTGLLVTGLSNMYFKGFSFNLYFLLNTAFGKMLLLKWIIFVLIVILLIIHDLYLGEKFIRKNIVDDKRFVFIARYSGRVNLLLSLIAMLLGILISRGIAIF